MRYVAMIGVFGGLGAAMGMGAQLAGFVDMPSLLLVLIGAVLFHCEATLLEVKEALAASDRIRSTRKGEFTGRYWEPFARGWSEAV